MGDMRRKLVFDDKSRDAHTPSTSDETSSSLACVDGRLMAPSQETKHQNTKHCVHAVVSG